jgi:hypothetical protein
MNNMGKFAIFLVLLAGLSVYSFAETFYGFSTGLFRTTEQFFDENYGKELDGININLDINHYPKSAFGWFIHGSAGAGISGFDWTDTFMSSLDAYSITDLRLSFGPSFKLVSGTSLVIPISIGPSIGNTREESYYYYYYDDYYYYYDDYYGDAFKETINIGVFADLSVILTLFKWLSIRTGISATWDFIRFERNGLQMNFRSAFNDQFTSLSFSSLNICVYSGIGIRIE